MTTHTLSLGSLVLLGTQQGPYIQVTIDGCDGHISMTLAQWTGLQVVADVLGAVDRRHEEDRSALIAAKAGIERGGELLKQAQAAMREQADALDAATEQRDAVRAEVERLRCERNELHAELKSVIDYAIDNVGMPVTAMLGPDAPTSVMRKLHAERDAARQECRELAAQLAHVAKERGR